MQPRMNNPANVVPGALEAMQKLGTVVRSAGVPESTLDLVEATRRSSTSAGQPPDIRRYIPFAQTRSGGRGRAISASVPAIWDDRGPR